MSANGRVLTAKKVAGSHKAACHLSKQRLFCFDRLERQGDNGLEYPVFVIGGDGAIVAIRCCLNAFQSPAVRGFVSLGSHKIAIVQSWGIALSIFPYDNELGIDPPDRQVEETQFIGSRFRCLQSVVQQVS